MSALSPIHVPMDQFQVQGHELLINGQPLSRVAARVGSTPFYAYDRSLLDARVSPPCAPRCPRA